VSRAVARRIIEAGDAAGIDAPAMRLASGTAFAVRLPAAEPELQPEDVPFQVAYESPDVLVVIKPPGVAVHPGAGRTHGTLANGLVARYPELAELGETYRWGLVHRLDRDTSGLLMVARTAAAHQQLQAELKARRVGRTYLALAAGRFDASTGTIEAPIGRDRRHPTRMAVQADGREARTHYRRLAEWADVTLLEVTLETGRTHQIRVHLASIGAPLVGDGTYGAGLVAAGDPSRIWLHATRLRFPDPETGREVVVAAPLPSDLRDSLEALGLPLRGNAPSTELEPSAQGSNNDEDAL
jgi:23S rRNA pseudouridine1911/1915/1917 synthase